MPAAAADRPGGAEPTLLEQAERMWQQLPDGYRVEVIGAEITVTPPPDGPHAEVLTDLTFRFGTVGAHGGETRVLQGVGLWLPDGPYDYAVPDLAVVDADYRDHVAENNCYDPAVFRLVLEVTSGNYGNDLKKKVVAYAIAKIPVYVIVDRKGELVHVLTDPFANEYDSHRVHAPGEEVALPDSVAGSPVTLSVADLLATGRR